MTLRKDELTIKDGLKIFDEPARKMAKVVVPLVSNQIVTVEDHPNQYSIDLIGYGSDGKPVAYIEVECSHSWNKLEFPWPKLSYLEERKGRYLYENKYFDIDMYFVMFNKNFTSFAITDRNSILQSPVVISERSWKGREKFRMIDKENFDWFVIKNLVKHERHNG